MVIQNKLPFSIDFSQKMNWKERFNALTIDEKNVLCFTAIHTAPTRKITVLELCKIILPPRFSEIKKFISEKKPVPQMSEKPDVNFEKLAKEGWIRLIGNTLISCTEEYRELIIQHLVQSKWYQEYAAPLFRKIGGLYFFSGYDHSYGKRSFERPSTPEDLIRELRHILITKNVMSLHQIFPYILRSNPAKQSVFYNTIKDFCSSEFSRIWFETTSIDIQSMIGRFFLVQTISNPITGLGSMWEILLQIANAPKCDLMLQIVLLDYAFCSGKLDDPRLNHLSGSEAPLLLNAHRSFLIGDYKEAIKSYRILCKLSPGIKWIKNSPIPYLAGVLHCLAELAAGDRIYVSKIIKTALSRISQYSENTAFLIPLDGCWKILDTITERLNGLEPKRIPLKIQNDPSSEPFWLLLLLHGYEGIWFQLKTEPELNILLLKYVWRNRIALPWVAAESLETALTLGAAKPPDFGWVETFRTKSKSVSLQNMLTPRKSWELILESLGAIISVTTKKSVAVKEKEKDKSRLIWKVEDKYSNGNLQFIPHQQTWNEKSQSWVTGKPITLSKLFKSMNTFPFLTDQDRNICSSIQALTRYGYRGTDYEFNDEIAVKFIGHPLLFSTANPPQLIELVSGHGEISMQEKDGNWHLTFSPPLLEHRYVRSANNIVTDDRNSSFFIVAETPLRFKVIKLSKQEIQIRTILGEKGQIFPKTAETELTGLLGKLAGTLIVKTDACIEFTDVPEVPANQKLYLYLTPNGEGLQAEFFVKPLGEESQAHRPGVGTERIIAEVNGQNRQTVRNLQEELLRREQFVSKIKTFQSAVSLSKDQYVFETPLDTLNFLSELKDSETKTTNSVPVKRGRKKTADKKNATEKEVEIYWPYGERFSVSSTVTFGNVNLAFSTLNEWLSAEGSVSVDGDSIELLRLLELLDENTENRFVKLNDKKFLALTNDLRKRLGELKRLSNVKGKSVQIHPLAASGLEDFFDAIPTLQKNAVWNNIKKRIAEARDYQAPFPKGFVGDLRDYQMEGYQWLARCAHWGVGCCLADDMGLGKTVQALALLLLRADQGPALVVAPTSVCFNWERETKRFAPMLNVKRIQPITTKAGLSKEERDNLITSAKKCDILLTSYSLLQQEIELFAQKKYATVILDESQAIKNPESQRAKAASMLQTDFRIGMTGTPIENNLTELWSLFRFLNSGLFGSQKSFEDRFAVPVQRDHSAGARNTLRRLVHPFILRRTKSQVLEELPARTEIVREIELSKEEMAFYETARLKALRELQEIQNENSGQGKLRILAALTQLRQLCCHSKLVLPDSNIESSKLEAFCEIMQELKDNRHKVLVFSQFVKHLSLLRTELDKMDISYQYLDGSTPAHERQKRVDAFQSGESDAFLISIKAGGSGLNLTAADYVIHTDPWWNPAVEDQATDRAHRIGQTRPVTVYRLITLGTIEEKIVRLHHEKRDLADKLLEGTDQTNKLSAEDLIGLLQS